MEMPGKVQSSLGLWKANGIEGSVVHDSGVTVVIK